MLESVVCVCVGIKQWMDVHDHPVFFFLFLVNSLIWLICLNIFLGLHKQHWLVGWL